MSFNSLLYHGHNARLVENGDGWNIVVTIDGTYFNYEQANEMLVYWQNVLKVCHEMALVTKTGDL